MAIPMKIDPPLTIIGCGPGSRNLLTIEAVEAAARLPLLIGPERLLHLFKESSGEKLPTDRSLKKTMDVIEEKLKTQEVGLLVSGDPGLFSLSAVAIKRFGSKQCRIISGMSSVQLAFNRLALTWSFGRIISAHGRIPFESAEELRTISPIALLCGEEQGQEWSLKFALELADTHCGWMCRNLGLENETITPLDFSSHREEVEALTVIILAFKENS